MKFQAIDPPREFALSQGRIVIKDCARIGLEPDEQVTFITAHGAEYDVARKHWGFYATPSTNGRLISFGLRACLTRNQDGRAYVFLVEGGKEDSFFNYLGQEGMRVIAWLDKDHGLDLLENRNNPDDETQCICGSSVFSTVHVYSEPPKGEVHFPIESGEYRRELMQCGICGHVLSRTGKDMEAIYTGEYIDATYGDAQGMRSTFERIINLPSERSDNTDRVDRIVDFLQGSSPRVLDVGSGLCVFLHVLKDHGCECTALDPDPRAVRHAREVAGVKAICGDFMHAESLGQYDLITFNKVLEHVADPVSMLSRASSCLAPGGRIYIELPDGPAAANDPEGYQREEFFIDHLHVFSPASAAILAEKAGFNVQIMERLQEPSSKYTLRLFLK